MDWFDVWDTVNQLLVGKVRTRVVRRGWAGGTFLAGCSVSQQGFGLQRVPTRASWSPNISISLCIGFPPKNSKLCDKLRTLGGAAACAAYLGVPRVGICTRPGSGWFLQGWEEGDKVRGARCGCGRLGVTRKLFPLFCMSENFQASM